MPSGNHAAAAVAGKYCLGELAVGSAIKLSGTIVTPFGAYRVAWNPIAFENALFLWRLPMKHGGGNRCGTEPTR